MPEVADLFATLITQSLCLQIASTTLLPYFFLQLFCCHGYVMKQIGDVTSEFTICGIQYDKHSWDFPP